MGLLKGVLKDVMRHQETKSICKRHHCDKVVCARMHMHVRVLVSMCVWQRLEGEQHCVWAGLLLHDIVNYL